MKKLLLVMLVVMLSYFMFSGISQAGECIYLYNWQGHNYYYNSSDVEYKGDIVSYTLYEDSCSSPTRDWDIDIDCAKRMIQDWTFGDDTWKPISPGSGDDTMRIKLCR
jgi:hypothetical protein